MEKQKKYNVAIYCRLSKDDDVRGSESSSIISQKEILERHVKQNRWRIHDYYIDDGWSGTNFRRPAFERMIEDIDDGKINLVITKDLSRLGRNYIQTGQFTEIYFPSKSVRYIALNDGVDTVDNDNGMAPFLNVLNDFYAKDVSKKVRTAVRAKKQRGDFVSSYAPYGYQKDPANRNRLIIEESGAKIVRRIFEMARADMGSKTIAKILNDEDVLSPSSHRAAMGLAGYKQKRNRWDPGTVMWILRNRMYIGDMVQGIHDCAPFKRTPTKRKPKDEWIITPGTHEPIVDVETWELVQKLISARKRPTKGKTIQLFAGFLKCEDCGLSLGYSASRGCENYTCSTYRRNGSKFCSCHYIRKDVLEQVVLDDIKKYSKLAKHQADELSKQVHAQNGDKDTIHLKALSTELERLNARNEELNHILRRLYEDNISGKISDGRFGSFLSDYEKEQSDIRVKIQSTEQTLEEVKANQKDTHSWIRLIRNYTRIKKLDRTVLTELVDKIVVGEAKEVDGHKVTDVTIYYRFVGAVNETHNTIT